MLRIHFRSFVYILIGVGLLLAYLTGGDFCRSLVCPVLGGLGGGTMGWVSVF